MFCVWLILTLSKICPSTTTPATRHVQTEWVQYFDQGVEGPGSYVYGFDIEDSGTDNVQFRHEQRDENGTVVGSYGLLEPDGNLKIVHYVADQQGYRTNIENTKHPNEAHPDSTLYNNIVKQLKGVDKIGEQISETTTKSSFLQSAEHNLPLLGQNYVNENHIPPFFHSDSSDGSMKFENYVDKQIYI